MMLIAGAINFVVFVKRDNQYGKGGRLQRYRRQCSRDQWR